MILLFKFHLGGFGKGWLSPVMWSCSSDLQLRYSHFFLLFSEYPRPWCQGQGCWGGSALALFHQIPTFQLLLPAQGWAEVVVGAGDGGRCWDTPAGSMEYQLYQLLLGHTAPLVCPASQKCSLLRCKVLDFFHGQVHLSGFCSGLWRWHFAFWKLRFVASM